MNPNNYGSLEACKRLFDAGIVVETDFWWFFKGNESHIESYSIGIKKYYDFDFIPALSMAEAWRELPAGTLLYTNKISYAEMTITYGKTRTITDAMIDLLIWVRTQKGE